MAQHIFDLNIFKNKKKRIKPKKPKELWNFEKIELLSSAQML